MFGNSFTFWNVRAMPSFVTWFGSRPTIDVAAEPDVAGIGRVQPGDHVEHRALARAVRADHRDDLALVDVQVQPVSA